MFDTKSRDPGLKTLKQIHRLFDKAEDKLVKNLGVPTCIPDCGKCCEIQNVSIRGVEARYLARWVQSQDRDTYDRIVGACEAWLLDRDRLSVYQGIGTMKTRPEDLDQLFMEGGYSNGLPCPMLSEDKRCLVYPARPILCRAYGVTRTPPIGCPRPLGKYEHDGYRAFINDETVGEIKNAIQRLKGEIEEGDYIENSAFLPTLLYAELQPQKFINHVYHNQIPSAKLLQFRGMALLWQEQVVELINSQQEIGMLVSPI